MKEVIGVIHFPLDAYNESLRDLEKWLILNLDRFEEGGINSVILQDQVIERKASIETIGRVTSLCHEARKKYPNIKLGLILDSNDCEATVKIALMTNIDFIRIKVFVGAMIKNTGIVEGCIIDNYKLINDAKNTLEIMADIYDKTGSPLGDVSYTDACIYAVKMGADKLILTGNNIENSKKIIREVREKVKSPIYIGGGVTQNNINEIKNEVSGCIVSSTFLEEGSSNNWSVSKIKNFMKEWTFQ